jgi:hypothetical protein
MNRFVLGIGTGRCGTESLSALLDNQSRATVTHERFRAQVPWGADGYEWLKHLIEDRPTGLSGFYGDVALYWLPQIEQLLLDPNRKEEADRLRVVALRRDREATVNSYMQKTGGPSGRNHWMVHDGTTYETCKLGWDHCFPKFRAADKREALSMYWAAYYGEVDRLATRYPEQVRCFDLDALNTREGQRTILQFVGLSREDQVLDVGIQKNSGPPHRAPQRPTVGSRLLSLYQKVLSSRSSSK